jgi:UDP:flavonoid glycosyltransferase YjiC (YdhE family)
VRTNAQRATRNAKLTVALAVSGHGFGHAVRCAEVARALLERGAWVKVRTDAPAWLFPEPVELVPSPGWPLDIGVAQHDGLELDIDETRRRWQAFACELEPRARVEAELLREHHVDVLLGDIPPLGFAAATGAGVPCAALTNFGWDWIYAAWPGFERTVETVRGAYRQADLLLRLPLHSHSDDAFPAFNRIEDVPLIARRARRSRAQVRAELGLPVDAQVVLLSFGGFTAGGLDVGALRDWSEYVFVLTPPLFDSNTRLPSNVVGLNQTPADYVSLLGASDVVVTKPGYGIAADCLANRVAILFTDRGPFREYDVLADCLPKLGRACYIPRAALLAGHVGPYLEALRAAEASWTDQPMNGADVVAERILRLHDEAKEVTFC